LDGQLLSRKSVAPNRNCRKHACRRIEKAGRCSLRVTRTHLTDPDKLCQQRALHEYQHLDDGRLWKIATVDLPALHPVILLMLVEFEG
jgi:hypothetical protein